MRALPTRQSIFETEESPQGIEWIESFKLVKSWNESGGKYDRIQDAKTVKREWMSRIQTMLMGMENYQIVKAKISLIYFLTSTEDYNIYCAHVVDGTEQGQD